MGARSCPLALACSSPLWKRVQDLAVPLEREDQRDVDADPLGEDGGDRGQPLTGGRDLDEDVRPVDRRPQGQRGGDRALGVLGEPGIDLDRHPAVHAVGRVVDRTQDVGRLPDVVRGDAEDRRVHVGAVRGELAQLLVVGVALRQRAREDGRVRGHADDALSATSSARFPVRRRSRERSSSQIATPASASRARGVLLGAMSIDPLLPRVGPGVTGTDAPVQTQTCWSPVSPSLTGSPALLAGLAPPRAAAIDSCAAATTASGVNPNSRKSVLSSADAP